MLPLNFFFFGSSEPTANQAEVDLFQSTLRFFNSFFGERIFRKVLHCFPPTPQKSRKEKLLKHNFISDINFALSGVSAPFVELIKIRKVFVIISGARVKLEIC